MFRKSVFAFFFVAIAGQAGLAMSADVAERVITVEINKGTMVKLDEAVTSIAVADPTTADVQVISSKLIFVHGKKIGETSIYAVNAENNTILNAVVSVTHNLSSLEREVKRMAPESDVDFKTVDGGLVMNGTASSPGESDNIKNIAAAYMGDKDKMVNMIKTQGSDQVTLKVRFVEMSRTDLKKIGVSLQNVTNRGNFSMQLVQGKTIQFFGSTPGQDVVLAPNSLIDRGSNTDTNAMFRYKDISGLIDALETQGMATILAEPTLTTISGEPASFLAGGQFPVPVVQSSTGSAPTISIQYQPFGVSLKFTPVVMNKNRISLTVAPEVSTLDFNNPIQVSGVTYPILDTRKASSVVELGSGESFMLAGLLQNETTNAIDKFPGLGDLPVLGALFRSTSFQNDQTELVILVTPYIVHPVAESAKMQTPIDGMKPPSDMQMLLQGNLYQQESMNDDDKENMPTLHGEGGFMTDESDNSNEKQP